MEITFVPSRSLTHEILTFRRRPENDSTVKAVIEHIKYFRDNLELDPDHGEEIYRVRLTVNGSKELDLSECEILSDADS
ncbi:MAG: hypothetical protein MJ171_07240 [Clostridia bacterium]|nr:hypothetical protein [Clostridia bacterium]